MNANLKSRLKKLEACLVAKEAGFPSVVFGEFDRRDDEIVGVGGGNGEVVARQPHEGVEAMIERAQRQLRQKIVFLTYSEGHSGDTCIVFPQDVGTP